MHETGCSMCGDHCPCHEACETNEEEPKNGQMAVYFWLIYLFVLASLSAPFWNT